LYFGACWRQSAFFKTGGREKTGFQAAIKTLVVSQTTIDAIFLPQLTVKAFSIGYKFKIPYLFFREVGKVSPCLALT